MTKLAILAALSVAVTSTTHAAPTQQAGVALLAESGGMRSGCVRWSYTVEVEPRRPDRERLIFTFTNACQRTVHVNLRSQSGDNAVVGRGYDVELGPGQSYGGPAQIRHHLQHNRAAGRNVRFWVFQSDTRFNFDNRNLVDMRQCKADHRPKASDPAPSCPNPSGTR